MSSTDGEIGSSIGSMTYVYHTLMPCEIEPSRADSPIYGFYYCQICKLLLTVRRNRFRLAIVCTRCLEATPIGNPPADKRFYRCICYCLLLVSRHQNIFVCPRSNCRAILVTEAAQENTAMIAKFLEEHMDSLKRPASQPVASMQSPNDPRAKDWGTVFISCGYCKQTFKVSPDENLSAEILCPECRNISALTPRFRRKMVRQHILYSLPVLLISTAITLGTYFHRNQNGGVVCITVGLFVAGCVLVLQALLYCTMPISTIISGAVGVD